MKAILGEFCEQRKTCGDAHLPGCYNPKDRETYCICGAVRWPGQVGVWRSAQVIETIPSEHAYGWPEYRIVGWDVYFLHAPGCTEQDEPHLCGMGG